MSIRGLHLNRSVKETCWGVGSITAPGQQTTARKWSCFLIEAATRLADARSGKMETRTPKGGFKLGALVASFFVLLIACSGCYLIRPSSGAGQTKFSGTRKIEPSSVAVDPGFRIEAVATGLTFPTGVTFDDRNNPCVVE